MEYYYFCSINSSSGRVAKSRLALAKSVSNKRLYNFKSEAKIEELKKIRLKKRTEAKMNWGVKSYNAWREQRLIDFNYDPGIFFADLNDLANLNKENFEHAMCRFIPEVTKSRGEGLYPAKTLYQLVVAIQKFLNVNKIAWKLVDLKSNEFEDLRTVLDNVMKERTEQNIGTIKRQADIISYEYEELLWEKSILGEDSPSKLRDTVLFLLGINLALRGVDEHYQLRREMPDKSSQISLERNNNGIKCLVYREDTCTKANDGGIAHMKKERKIVWVYPSENVERCPVRIVEKYLSLCPSYFVKKNFYLQSLQKTKPFQWYGEQVVGSGTLSKVVKKLLNDAKIDGYFTNHSLRRTAPTRLFQAGVDRKIVKEITGHRSDAIDCYQITSEDQQKRVSAIISGESNVKSGENSLKNVQVEGKTDGTKSETKAIEGHAEKSCHCNCNCNKANIGQIIQQIVDTQSKSGKTVIKMNIEIINQ